MMIHKINSTWWLLVSHLYNLQTHGFPSQWVLLSYNDGWGMLRTGIYILIFGTLGGVGSMYWWVSPDEKGDLVCEAFWVRLSSSYCEVIYVAMIYLFYYKMKHGFPQAVVVSILLYGCILWTLTKCLEKKLDSNYTRMLWAILNKS